jgi:hypothetical protein
VDCNTGIASVQEFIWSSKPFTPSEFAVHFKLEGIHIQSSDSASPVD